MSFKKHPGVLLAIIWVVVIYAIFYSVQKPLTPEAFLAIGHSLLNIAAVLLILLAAMALGWRFLGSLAMPSGERLLFSTALGLGLISVATLVLGLFGLLFSWLFYALSLVLVMILLPQMREILRDLRLSFPARPPWGIAVYLAFGISLPLLLGLAPPISFDALLYHLEGPKTFIQAHGIYPVDNMPLYFPSLVEMLFTYAMLLKGDIAAQLLHYLLGLLCAGALLLMARKYYSERAAWWALVLFLSMPMVPLIMGWAYVDMGLVLFGLLAFHAIQNWRDSKDGRWLLLGGCLAGLAMGVKYTAFVFALTLAGMILYECRRDKALLLRSVLLFSLLTLVVASPWYLRNLYLVGNPFYPFFFGGKYWDGFLTSWYQQAGTGIGFSWQLLALPVTATLGIKDVTFYDGRVGPILLALAPLALALASRAERGKKVTLYCLAMFAAQFAFWTLGVMHSQSLFQARLLLPGLAFLCLAMAPGMEHLEGLHLRRFFIGVVAIALVLALLVQASEFASHNPLPYLLGLESREGYLNRNLSYHYQAMVHINQDLSPSEGVQFLWEPRSYYCQRGAQPDVILGAFKDSVYRYETASAIVEEWQKKGITHLLIYQWGLDFMNGEPRSALTDKEMRVLNELKEGYLEVVYEDDGGNYLLYKIR